MIDLHYIYLVIFGVVLVNSAAIIVAIYIVARVLFHWDAARKWPGKEPAIVYPKAMDEQEQVEQEKEGDLDDEIEFADDADEVFDEVR